MSSVITCDSARDVSMIKMSASCQRHHQIKVQSYELPVGVAFRGIPASFNALNLVLELQRTQTLQSNIMQLVKPPIDILKLSNVELHWQLCLELFPGTTRLTSTQYLPSSKASLIDGKGNS